MRAKLVYSSVPVDLLNLVLASDPHQQAQVSAHFAEDPNFTCKSKPTVRVQEYSARRRSTETAGDRLFLNEARARPPFNHNPPVLCGDGNVHETS